MAVTHVATNGLFDNPDVVVSVPAGSNGDEIVVLGGDYANETGYPPWRTGNAAHIADFPLVGQTFIQDGSDIATGGVYSRTADGTEDATYTLIGQDTGVLPYGTFQTICRITEAQLQTTAGGVYTYTSGSQHAFPAYTVDTDGSLVVVCIMGYNSAPNNTTITGQGYVSRSSLDGGWWRVYTKEVNAGSVGQLNLNSDSGAVMTILTVWEPVGGVTTVDLASSGSTSATASAVLDATLGLSSTGSTSAAASAALQATLGMSSTGTSSAAASAVSGRTAELASSGTSSASASATLSRTAQLASTGTTSASATAALSRTVSLASSGTSSAAVTGTLQATLGLASSGTSSATATGVATKTGGTVDLSSSGTSSAAASATLAATVGLASSGTTTASATATTSRTVELASSDTTSATATGTLQATLGLASTGTTTATATGVATRTGTTVLVQEGFRWGTDDGTEAAHGWEAAQDTDPASLTSETTYLLRVVVDETGGAAVTDGYKLQYRRDDEPVSEWRDVS